MTFLVINFILTKLCEIPFLIAIRNIDRKIRANLCQCATSTPLVQRAVQKLAPSMLLCHAMPCQWHTGTPRGKDTAILGLIIKEFQQLFIAG